MSRARASHGLTRTALAGDCGATRGTRGAGETHHASACVPAGGRSFACESSLGSAAHAGRDAGTRRREEARKGGDDACLQLVATRVGEPPRERGREHVIPVCEPHQPTPTRAHVCVGARGRNRRDARARGWRGLRRAAVRCGSLLTGDHRWQERWRGEQKKRVRNAIDSTTRRGRATGGGGARGGRGRARRARRAGRAGDASEQILVG